MGFNYPLVGCTHIQAFVNLMCKSEAIQLDLFCQYIIHECLDDELRERRWDDFARRYNGPAYQLNRYAKKLAQAYKKNGGVL